jgi:hypothetical protein
VIDDDAVKALADRLSDSFFEALKRALVRSMEKRGVALATRIAAEVVVEVRKAQ